MSPPTFMIFPFLYYSLYIFIRYRLRLFFELGMKQQIHLLSGNKHFFKIMPLSDLPKLWTKPTKTEHIFRRPCNYSLGGEFQRFYLKKEPENIWTFKILWNMEKASLILTKIVLSAWLIFSLIQGPGKRSILFVPRLLAFIMPVTVLQ